MGRRTWAIAVKEARQIRRDPRTLGLLVVVPAVMLALYGYALTFDVKHIRVAVLDHSRSAGSRAFRDGLFHSEYFQPAGALADLPAAAAALDGGQARAVLVIPRDFGARLAAGERTAVQALIAGDNAHAAHVALTYLEGRVRQANRQRLDELAARHGTELTPPLRVEPRVWYNPELDSSRSLLPGLVGFLLMVIGAVSTSLSVVREKERGTLEQLQVSAVRPAEFVAGKVLPYLAIMLFTEALILLAARVLFAMPLRGGAGWLLAASVVYLLGGLGVGLLISTIATTQQVAFQIAALATMLPSMLLSDLVFPIASMPWALRQLTWLVPARHFIAILRGLLLKGAGPRAWGLPLLVLIVFAAGVFGLAARRLARQLRGA